MGTCRWEVFETDQVVDSKQFPPTLHPEEWETMYVVLESSIACVQRQNHSSGQVGHSSQRILVLSYSSGKWINILKNVKLG